MICEKCGGKIQVVFQSQKCSSQYYKEYRCENCKFRLIQIIDEDPNKVFNSVDFNNTFDDIKEWKKIYE